MYYYFIFYWCDSLNGKIGMSNKTDLVCCSTVIRQARKHQFCLFRDTVFCHRSLAKLLFLCQLFRLKLFYIYTCVREYRISIKTNWCFRACLITVEQLTKSVLLLIPILRILRNHQINYENTKPLELVS